MELRQLKYFATVADTLSFSEASRRLFITQGTLSQQIMQLEDEIGLQLFERTSHSVTLTEAGEALLPMAENMLETSRECRDKMNDIKQSLCGTLNIGVTHSFSTLLTDTVKSFLKQYPGVNLKIYYETAAELMDMLMDKQIDIALAFKPIKPYEDIEDELLFKSHLSVVMRKDHPLADRESLTIEDLDNQGIVLPGTGLQARRIFERYLGVDTRKMNVRVELNDPNIIMDIVQGTNLVTLVSSLAAYYRTNLVAVPLESGGHEMLGCVHRLKGAYRKRSSEAFLETLRDVAHIDRICRNLSID